nr:hypothetical protein Iba_scaffold16262CG0010 [Ipomoea batatas]
MDKVSHTKLVRFLNVTVQSLYQFSNCHVSRVIRYLFLCFYMAVVSL